MSPPGRPEGEYRKAQPAGTAVNAAPTPPPTRIFISYRRAGEDGFVGRLTDRLAALYGEAQVFRDVSGLRPGESFEQRIGATLDGAHVVIAVIGSQWVGRRRFRRRLLRLGSIHHQPAYFACDVVLLFHHRRGTAAKRHYLSCPT